MNVTITQDGSNRITVPLNGGETVAQVVGDRAGPGVSIYIGGQEVSGDRPVNDGENITVARAAKGN